MICLIVLIFVGATLLTMRVLMNKPSQNSIESLAKKMDIDGQDLNSDYSGHTTGEYDFEAQPVGQIADHRRAFIEVKATKNAHIALAETASNDSRMYEICFGDSDDFHSWIRSSDDVNNFYHLRFGSVFEENNIRIFEIDWSNPSKINVFEYGS